MAKRKLNRDQLLAAEIYSYSYDNYENHLGIGNLRFEKYMPDGARTLEQAVKENWPRERIAKKLEVEPDHVDEYMTAYRNALDVVDAENPAESFRAAVRQCIERALRAGLRDENSIEELVKQICYRAADLGFLLDMDGNRLSRYSRHLRREAGVEYGEGYFDGVDE